MITEDYVSFETAKLLKEKGFDVPCTVWYAEYTSQYGSDIYNVIQYDNYNRFEEGYKFLFYVPTLQMAMKWLREVHKLYVNVCPCVEGYYWTENWHSYAGNLEEKYPFEWFIGTFNSHEEACEAAIKYCLENLI